nr:YcdB/YcdC domain-containing protein [Brevibacillus laterosporus]
MEITKITPNAKGKISREQAQEKAFRFLEKYLDPWDKEVQLTYSNNDENSYRFRFFKSYQGIPVLPTVDSYVSYLVEIDSVTGEGIRFTKQSIKEPFFN